MGEVAEQEAQAESAAAVALRALGAALAEAERARLALAAGGAAAGSAREVLEAAELRVASFRHALLRLGEAALDAFLAGALPFDPAAVSSLEPAPLEPVSPEVSGPPAPSFSRAVVLERPPPPRAEFDAAYLEALQQRLSESGISAAPASAEDVWYQATWGALGEVPAVASVADFAAAFKLLRSQTQPSKMRLWPSAPVPDQRSFFEHLVARARHLQEEVSPSLRPSHARGDKVFQAILRNLKAEAKARRVDFVFGFGREHRPRRGTWAAEAATLRARADRPDRAAELATRIEFNPERALDVLRDDLDTELSDEALRSQVRVMLRHGLNHLDPRLVDLLVGQADRLVGSEFASLRYAIRRLAREQAAEEAAELAAEAGLGDDEAAVVWPLAEVLRGKRVVLIGGDRPTQPLQRLRDLLPDTSVEWLETSASGGTRQVQSLVHRINYGMVDIVLLVQRFLSHKVSGSIVDAARASPSRVRVEMVRRGYGLSQIRRALTRTQASPPAPA